MEHPASGGEATPAAYVTAIYPDVAEVPVNLLKIYVQFSEPMSEGRAERAVRVCRDDTLEPMDGVFVPMDPELWDRQRQRLTLLLDPARIKHGLVPNLEVGYPLIEGVPFRLFINPDFRDAGGQTLRAGAERRYEVGPEIRERIDQGKWRYVSLPPGRWNPCWWISSVPWTMPSCSGVFGSAARKRLPLPAMLQPDLAKEAGASPRHRPGLKAGINSWWSGSWKTWQEIRR